MGKLGHLVESLRARVSRGPVNEDVIGSLLILAKDIGGQGKSTRGDFVGDFRDEKQVANFLRTVSMEYPGIAKDLQRTNTSDGRIELSLSPRAIRKFGR
jgi:hypothetical protein